MSDSRRKSHRIPSWTLVIGITLGIALLAAIAIPRFVKHHPRGISNPCIENLRRIDAAVCQFALEHHLTNGASINYPDDLMPYLDWKGIWYDWKRIPTCPAGGVYHVSKVGENPTCTLSTLTPPHALQ